MKDMHERRGPIELTQADALKAAELLKHYRDIRINAGGHVMLNSPGAVQATNVTIKSTRRSVKSLPALGSLGSEVVRRNYVKHLIDQYNEFAKKQTDRARLSLMQHFTALLKSDSRRTGREYRYPVSMTSWNSCRTALIVRSSGVLIAVRIPRITRRSTSTGASVRARLIHQRPNASP